MNDKNKNTSNVDAKLDEIGERLEVEQLQAEQPTAQQETQAKTDSDEIRKALVLFLETTFSLVCPAWNIQDSEVGALAEAYAVLLDKYFPGGLARFGPEVNALLITLVVFAPRMRLPRKVGDQEGQQGPAPHSESDRLDGGKQDA